jgi:hypothetical protein
VFVANAIAGRYSLTFLYCESLHLRSMAPIIWLARSQIALPRGLWPPVVI